MNRYLQKGFSVYELLITVLIVGIILTIGVPNMAEFTANSRISATANDLHSSFLLARSEAARSKANVTICTSANPMAANPQCDGSPFDSGWIIFVDVNGDINVDNPAVEPVLRRHGAVPNTLNITTNGGAAYFSFAPTGLGRGNIGGGPAVQQAVICDNRGNTQAAGGWSAARYLVVTPIGRSTILRDVAQIAAAGGCP